MEDINLFSLINLAYRRIWALIGAFIVCAGLGFGYSKFIAVPSYNATASIIVTNGAIIDEQSSSKTGTVASTDVIASTNLINTIIDILNAPGAYKDLAKELGGKYKYSDLKSMTSINRKGDDTLVIEISVKNNNSAKAIEIVNSFVDVACKYVTEFIPYSNSKVVSQAETASQTFPRPVLITGVAGVIGALAMFALFFIFESMNKTIKGEEDLVKKYDIPLLGAVPDFESANNGVYSKYYGTKKGGK